VPPRQVTLNAADALLDVGAALLFLDFFPDLLLGHAQLTGVPAPVPDQVNDADDKEYPGAVVAIDLPDAWANRPVEFVAEMENLTVDADRREKIVINEKTGTILLGKDVRISPVAIIHGALNVEVRTAFEVSQPEGFSAGRTTVTPQTNVDASQDKAKHLILDKGATVEQLVHASIHRIYAARRHRHPG
jgi:flagellar basal body P-ring protein FlgI